MIRRELTNGWILFTQDDHANLAGDIMNFWGNNQFLSIKPFEEVIFAIRNHDIGWLDWDNRPKINKENNYPANFMEMNSEEQKRIWSKSFEKDLDEHCYSSALIALHFSKLNEKSILDNPGDTQSQEMQKKINKLIESVFDIYYNSLKDNELNPETMTNLKFVQIGDIISLALCHGWLSTELKDVPLDYENNTVDIKLISEDGFNYKIDPNPFSLKKLSASINGKRLLKKKFDNDDELRSSLSKSQLEKFYFNIE
ncbi:MAG: DUF3891 family protein [Thermodesulfobacteriota bacterium]